MVWTPHCVAYKRAVRHLYPSIQWLEEGSWIGLPLLTLISPVDDVGFLEQLYFPIRFSFSCTTLHKDVTYNPIWNQNCCQNSSSILAEKKRQDDPSFNVCSQEGPQWLERITILIHRPTQLSFSPISCLLTNASNLSKDWLRNFGILVTLQWLDRSTYIVTMHSSKSLSEILCCPMRQFFQKASRGILAYLFLVNNAMTFVDSNLLASHS